MHAALYEFRHKERLSNNVLKDLEKSKSFFNNLIKKENEINNLNNLASDKMINDFIHYPSADPFGYILLSKYQVKYLNIK